MDQVAAGPDPGDDPGPVRAHPELPLAHHHVPAGGHHPVELDRPTSPLRTLGGHRRARQACRLRLNRPGIAGAFQGRWEPQTDRVPLSGGHGGEPFGRGDRRFLIERLVGPAGVVFSDVDVHGCQGLLRGGERPGDVEEVAAEGAVEALGLPVLVR